MLIAAVVLAVIAAAAGVAGFVKMYQHKMLAGFLLCEFCILILIAAATVKGQAD
ncbi:MAG: hypothetical protein JWO96_333 [Candidatus Saccharibacteria bacterium]|nr:hypothetical protein [Candidatus Saccharibacteria bacterium]